MKFSSLIIDNFFLGNSAHYSDNEKTRLAFMVTSFSQSMVVNSSLNISLKLLESFSDF